MATRSKKGNSEERGTDDDTEDGEFKDASAAIADLSTAVTAITEISTAMRTEATEVRTVLGTAAAALQEVQTFFQSIPTCAAHL